MIVPVAFSSMPTRLDSSVLRTWAFQSQPCHPRITILVSIMQQGMRSPGPKAGTTHIVPAHQSRGTVAVISKSLTPLPSGAAEAQVQRRWLRDFFDGSSSFLRSSFRQAEEGKSRLGQLRRKQECCKSKDRRSARADLITNPRPVITWIT